MKRDDVHTLYTYTYYAYDLWVRFYEIHCTEAVCEIAQEKHN